jgi:hypothetical protein
VVVRGERQAAFPGDLGALAAAAAKDFSASPHLVIKYNTPPQTPYGMATSPGGTACVQGTGRPLINPSLGSGGNLTLSTQLKDPDKDSRRP